MHGDQHELVLKIQISSLKPDTSTSVLSETTDQLNRIWDEGDTDFALDVLNESDEESEEQQHATTTQVTPIHEEANSTKIETAMTLSSKPLEDSVITTQMTDPPQAVDDTTIANVKPEEETKAEIAIDVNPSEERKAEKPETKRSLDDIYLDYKRKYEREPTQLNQILKYNQHFIIEPKDRWKYKEIKHCLENECNTSTVTIYLTISFVCGMVAKQLCAFFHRNYSTHADTLLEYSLQRSAIQSIRDTFCVDCDIQCELSINDKSK